MAIPEHDNRLQFPPTLIDFDNQVGITGQAHDNYPAPGQQSRYDWQRMFLISLLANQSSDSPPTQYRTGTIWFNRTTVAFEYYNGTEWKELSNAIQLKLEASDPSYTLQQFFVDSVDKLNAIKKKFTFSGESNNNHVKTIPIPANIVTEINDTYNPLVYINGLLVDPRLCRLSPGCPNSVELLGSIKLNRGNKFTVIIDHFDIFDSNSVIV